MIELTKEQRDNLYELSVILYEKKGQEATEKLGELFDLPLTFCKFCEAMEPSMDKACFICGSSQ